MSRAAAENVTLNARKSGKTLPFLANGTASILAALAFFFLLYSVTVPDLTGDTPVYAGDILKYFQQGAAAAPRLLWEFGHLFWRPLGYGLWRLGSPLLSHSFGGNRLLEITAVLFVVNFLSGVALTLLTFAIARRLGLSSLAALLVTLGILLCNTVLNYVHSGCSYIPGVTVYFGGFWLMLRAIQDQRLNRVNAIGCGFLLALASALWFPYVLGIPAVLAAGLAGIPGDAPVSMHRLGERTLLAGYTLAATVAFGLAFFAAGAAACHIGSISGFHAWMASSSHGIVTHRSLLRFPTGITRSFLYFGDEGVTIKRFVFGDPYAPVRALDLIGAGLWKVALVAITFCLVLFSLPRTHSGRLSLAVLLAAMAPVLFFALVLFETSEPERYLPLYAGVLCAICEIARRKRQFRAAFAVLVFSFAVMGVLNVKTYAWDLRTSAHDAAQRVRLVHEHTTHNGVAFLLSFRDPVSTYFQRVPFDPLNRENAVPLYHVTEPANAAANVSWERASSCRILEAWRAGGEAWLSKRLIASRPAPEWQWVENDVAGLHWADLHRFFSGLNTDGDIGGADGFVRISRNSENEKALEGWCGSRANH